jgi:ABC-type molybdate transport system ATPase subunit
MNESAWDSSAARVEQRRRALAYIFQLAVIVGYFSVRQNPNF